MKIAFYIMLVGLVILQIQIIALLILNGKNIQLWNAQDQLNTDIIHVINK